MISIPAAGRFVLRNARALGHDGLSDIEIDAGRIAAITPTISAPPTSAPGTDIAGRIVWPGMVDMHTHLDKGHIWPRAENPDGSFLGARTAVAADREKHWTAEDVTRRFEFGLRCAYSHGTVAMRTHIDSLAPQHRISWPVFAEMRERWRGRITLQGVALIPLPALDDAAYTTGLMSILRANGGVLGGLVMPMERLEERLGALLRLAGENGLDLDLHVDETLDPEARSLPLLAELALAQGFAGRITVGHCCSLSVQPEAELARTLDLLVRARIGVVSLPMCNLFLQDRAASRTPRLRGVTVIQELAAHGIPVAVASDNTRDPFYAYGDHDLLEVYREAVRIAHLDRPFGVWANLVTRVPAELMGVEAGCIAVGAPADLSIFHAREATELLSRPHSDRIVLRAGKPIDTTPPDYAELDITSARS